MTRLKKWAFVTSVLLATIGAPRAYPYAVSTGTTWATEAAIEALRNGGNAVDAMVAATFMLNVTQPYNMGIGGGGFFLVSKQGKIFLWDHRELAPASAHEKMFLDKDGKPLRHYPEAVTGPNPVGVPGTIAGVYEAHRKLGRLPWKKLLEPAIRRAREGYPLIQTYANVLNEEWPRISAFPSTVAIFGSKDGSGPLQAGHILRNPLLAQTLETIATKGASEFYRGALAKSWLAAARELGVKFTDEDLKNFKVRDAKPVEFKIFGLRAVTAAPPSGSGLMVAGTLRYLEHYYKSHDVPEAGSAARIIVTTETLRFFQKLRNENIADEPWSKIDPRKFLGSAEEKAAWEELDKRVTARLDRIQTRVTAITPGKHLPTSGKEPFGHTAQLSVVDDDGLAVSYTTTIEEWFGSGMAVPGHGFMLNNELSDFTSTPGTPNSPAPGKRPRSNMSPVILMDAQSRPVGVVGCAGGPRIPTVVVELLENYYLHKMTAREAISYPRFHPDDEKLQVEKSTPPAVVEQLVKAGYDVEVNNFGGTAQALLRRKPSQAWEAATEPRADGLGIALEPPRERSHAIR